MLKRNEMAENSKLYELEQYRAVVRALESEDVLKRFAEQDDVCIPLTFWDEIGAKAENG